MGSSNRYPAIHTKHLLGASNSTILEEDLPGVVLANSPSNHSSMLQSIPHRSDQLNFSLNGDGMRLGDPSFKTNQERVAGFILEQLRHEASHDGKAHPFPYLPAMNDSNFSQAIVDRQDMHQQLREFKAVGDELKRELLIS